MQLMTLPLTLFQKLEASLVRPSAKMVSMGRTKARKCAKLRTQVDLVKWTVHEFSQKRHERLPKKQSDELKKLRQLSHKKKPRHEQIVGLK